MTQYASQVVNNEIFRNLSLWSMTSALVVCESHMIVVLLVLVLKQLTQLAKHFAAWLTMVGEIGDLVRTVVVILQHERHELLHLLLSIDELIDLLSGVVFTNASSAVSTLDMLNSIRTRSEASIATYRTSNSASAVYLHMHVEIVLTLEVASANGTNVGGCRKRSFVDALDATRTPFPFLPLIVAEVATVKVVTTPATIPGCHD